MSILQRPSWLCSNISVFVKTDWVSDTENAFFFLEGSPEAFLVSVCFLVVYGGVCTDVGLRNDSIRAHCFQGHTGQTCCQVCARVCVCACVRACVCVFTCLQTSIYECIAEHSAEKSCNFRRLTFTLFSAWHVDLSFHGCESHFCCGQFSVFPWFSSAHCTCC